MRVLRLLRCLFRWFWSDLIDKRESEKKEWIQRSRKEQRASSWRTNLFYRISFRCLLFVKFLSLLFLIFIFSYLVVLLLLSLFSSLLVIFVVSRLVIICSWGFVFSTHVHCYAATPSSTAAAAATVRSVSLYLKTGEHLLFFSKNALYISPSRQCIIFSLVYVPVYSTD